MEKPSSIHLDPSKDEHSVSSIAHGEEDIAVTWRSYVAVLAFCLIQVFQVWSLFGAAFMATSMATYTDRIDLVHWIPITTSLGQAVFAPLFSNCSDLFGHTKLWIGIPLCFSVIGSIVTGTASTMGGILGGQALTSIGLGTTALGYSAPSAMCPRRWRPMIQALLNIGAACGAIPASLTAGALLSSDPVTGWKTVYWIQIALGVAAVVFFFVAYNPVQQVRKETGNWKESVYTIDLVGISLLASGLLLLILGISFGGNPYPWSSATPISLIVVGFSLLVAFGAWETKRGDGILPVAMFSNRNFPLAIISIFLEGVLLFGVVVFLPVQSADQWDTNPFNISLRVCAFWLPAFVLAAPIGWISSRFKTFKIPLILGFISYLGGLIGMSLSTNETTQIPIFFTSLLGIGFAPILILLVAISQLSTPPALIGTSSAVLVSTRAVGASITPAFLGAILTAKITSQVPVAVAAAVIPLGLPLSSVGPFIGALLSGSKPAIMKVPGVTLPIVGAAVEALEGALAQSFKWIWIALIPFACVGIIVALLLNSQELVNAMTKHIDAPMEELEYVKGSDA